MSFMKNTMRIRQGILAILFPLLSACGGLNGSTAFIGSNNTTNNLTITADQTAVSVTEGDQSIVVVSLSEARAEDVTLFWSVEKQQSSILAKVINLFSTAESSDFENMSGALLIPAGASAASILFKPITDSLYEQTENFKMKIGGPSKNTIELPIEVLDLDQQPTLTLHAPATIFGQSTLLTGKLSVKSALPTSLSLNFIDNTAVRGTHYSVAAKVDIVIAENSDSFSLEIPTTLVGSGDRNFSVSLSDLVNCSAVDNSAYQINLIDVTGSGGGAASSVISVSDMVVGEGDGQAVVNLAISPALAAAASVSYRTAADTALEGDDYTKTTGTLTLTAGATTASVQIPITNDSYHETNESFELVLFGMDGVSSSTAVVRVEIQDNDPAPTPVVISPASTSLLINTTRTFSGSGGVAPYTFSKIIGPGNINSATGVYTAPATLTGSSAVVRITDSVGQVADAMISIYEPLVISPTNKSLVINESHTFTVVGGVLPYTFSVKAGGGSINSSSGVFTAPADLSAGTSTVISVTDANSTTADASITLAPALAISPTSASVVTGGTQLFAATGGFAPYTFSVTSGVGTINSSTGLFTAPATLTGSSAVVRVTDSLGHTSSANLAIFEPMEISPVSKALFVGETQTFIATGGIAPYVFSVQSGGGSVNSDGLYTAPANLAAGNTAVVLVTAANGNSATATINLALPLQVNPTSVQVATGGNQTFTASGGFAPYSYSLVSGVGSVNASTGAYSAPATLTGTTALLRVTDNAARTADMNVTIYQSLAISPTTVSVLLSGSANFSAVGGVGARTYSIKSGGGSINASTGVYSAPADTSQGSSVVVSVQDSIGNMSDATVNLALPVAISPTSANVANGAQQTFTATGGVPPYTFTKQSGGGTVTTAGVYTGPLDTSAGTTIIRVTDSGGLYAEATVTVPGVAVAIANPTSGTVINSSNRGAFAVSGTCSENAENVVLAVTGMANSILTCSGGNWSTTLDLTSVANGNVTFTATHTNTNSVTATATKTILKASGPTITISSPSVVAIKSTGSVIYTLTYNNATTITLAAGDITLNGATAGCTKAVSGSGSTSRTVTIANCSGDGALTFSIAANTAVDGSAEQSTTAGPSPQVLVDNTIPTLTITNPLDNSSSFGASVVVGTCESDASISISGDIAGGAAQTGLCTAGNFSIPINYSSGDGVKVINITEIDVAGNQASLTRNITKDTLGPSLPDIKILNNSTEYTQQLVVDLNLFAIDPSTVSEMYITNSFACIGGGTWETYATTKANWTLPNANSLNTVYAMFRDSLGNQSPCISDTITHDTTAPTLTIVSATQVTAPFTVTFNFSDLVTGFSVSDISVTNGSLSSFAGSGNSYSVLVTPTTSGNVELSVAANSVVNQVALNGPATVVAQTISYTPVQWSQQAYIKSTVPHAGDKLGNAVAISGDTMVVGVELEDSAQTTITNGSGASTDITRTNSGAAFVFRRNGSTWAQEAYLKPPFSKASDQFGNQVAIDGDYILVSARLEDTWQVTTVNGTFSGANDTLLNPTDVGAVYVFKRTGTQWAFEAVLKPTNAFTSGAFGSALDISGSTAVVGAVRDNTSQTLIINGPTAPFYTGANNNGAIFVFRRTHSSWIQEAYFRQIQGGDFFGDNSSIDIDGDMIVAGVPLEDSSLTGATYGFFSGIDELLTDSGVVYAFQRVNGQWVNHSYLKAPVTEAGDKFGASVSLNAGTLVVGAPNDDSADLEVTNGSYSSGDNTLTDSGAAYVYKLNSENEWEQQAYLKASNANASDLFGAAVAIYGDTIVVGATQEDSNQATISNGTLASTDNSFSNAGAAYVFKRSGVTWFQQAYLKASNVRNAINNFGAELAIWGDTVVVGYPLDDANQAGITNGTTSSTNIAMGDAGAVFVFKGSDQFASLVGAPPSYLNSYYANFDITVGGGAIVSYKYKLFAGETESCATATGYSAVRSTSVNIADNISAFPDGKVTLCVVGIDSVGGMQDYLNATQKVWIKDTVAPAPPTQFEALAAYLDSANQSVPFKWNHSPDFGSNKLHHYEIAVGPSPGVYSSQTWTQVGVGNSWRFIDGLDLPLATLLYAGLRAVDLAGNASTVATGPSWTTSCDPNGYCASNITRFTPMNAAEGGGAGYAFSNTFNSGDPFGWGGNRVLAMSDDRLVVGAYHDSAALTTITMGNIPATGITYGGNTWTYAGAVYVYKRTGATWAHEAYIKAPIASGGVWDVNSNLTLMYDHFGYTVAIDGNLIAVSSYDQSASTTIINSSALPASDNAAGKDLNGSVYLYRFNGSAWVQEAWLKPPYIDQNDYYGQGLAIANNRVYVGVNREDSDATGIAATAGATNNNNKGDNGAVYVYAGGAGAWALQAYIKPPYSNDPYGQYFGKSVAASGDTLVVGATAEKSTVNVPQNPPAGPYTLSTVARGAAYVYRYKNSTTGWYLESMLKGKNTDDNDGFGFSVAISGDNIVVGAPYEDSNQNFITNGPNASTNNSLPNAGAAYIYKRTGATWEQTAYLKAPAPSTSDYFGFQVAIQGDLVAVSQPADDARDRVTFNTTQSWASADTLRGDSGAVLMYRLNQATGLWAQSAYVKPPVFIPGADYWFGGFTLFNGRLAVSQLRGATSDNSSSVTLFEPGAAIANYASGGPAPNTTLGPTQLNLSGISLVGGNGVNFYKYKFVTDASQCADSSGYSSNVAIGTAVASNQSGLAVAEDIRLTLCVVGVNTTLGRTQPYDQATRINWMVDNYSRPPINLAPQYANFQSTLRSPVISWTPGGDFSGEKDYSWALGTTAGAADLVAWTAYSNVLSTQLTGLNLTPGSTYYFSLKARDMHLNISSVVTTSWTVNCPATGWCQQAYVKADVNDLSDGFGSAVHISGDVMVIGQPNEDSNSTAISTTVASDNAAADAGAVHVYRRNAGTWVFDSYIKAPNARAGDNFGKAVSVFGNVIAVGATLEDGNQTTISATATPLDYTKTSAGAVYIYRYTAGNWVFESYIKASNNGDDSFGTRLSLTNDSLAVGVPLEDGVVTTITNGTTSDSGNTFLNSGAVFVYRYNSTTGWAQEAYIKSASNENRDDSFGDTISMSGDTLAVGAPLDDSNSVSIGATPALDNTFTDAGAVHVFKRTGVTWAYEAYLKPSNNIESNDKFGASVSLSGNLLAVGQPLEDSSQTSITNITNTAAADVLAVDAGAVFVFKRTGASWSQQSYIKPSNLRAGDNFGAAVAISGETLVVASPLEDSADGSVANGAASSSNASAANSGAAYVFKSTAGVWSQVGYIKTGFPSANAGFGNAISISGDTAVISASLEDSNATGVVNSYTSSSNTAGTNTGAAFVYYNAGSVGFAKNFTRLRLDFQSTNTQVPTLGVEYSDDGVTWTSANSTALAANTRRVYNLVWDTKGNHRYWRIKMSYSACTTTADASKFYELALYALDDREVLLSGATQVQTDITNVGNLSDGDSATFGSWTTTLCTGYSTWDF